jgi:MinD-like ATPase involved in chromosome partitioning or flagellar assembly
MPKRIVFTQGGKGGVGKTTAALSLFDYYQTKAAGVTLADFDSENKAKGGLNFWHKSAEKVDIHTRAGLDRLLALTLTSGNDIILADMGAGSGAVTYKWFDTVYPELAAEDVKATSIGVITDDPGSVDSVMTWVQHLGDNVQYLIILNELDQPEETFRYWHESKTVKDFIACNSPKVIKMESRRPDLEQAARNHGASIAQIAERKTKAPELQNVEFVIRAQGYRRRINAQFETAADILFP